MNNLEKRGRRCLHDRPPPGTYIIIHVCACKNSAESFMRKLIIKKIRIAKNALTSRATGIFTN